MTESESRMYNQAIIFAAEAHAGQVRKYTGEPYVLHPIEVAEILRRHDRPASEIVGGVLHDVVEDTNRTLKQVKFHFGTVVGDLVNGVTNVAEDKSVPRVDRFWQNVAHLAEQSEGSHNIKCADIISNLKNFPRNDETKLVSYSVEKVIVLDHLYLADSNLIFEAKEIISKGLVGVNAEFNHLRGIIEKARPQYMG